MNPRMSCFVTRPPMPEPCSARMSMWCSFAIFRTRGDDLARRCSSLDGTLWPSTGPSIPGAGAATGALPASDDGAGASVCAGALFGNGDPSACGCAAAGAAAAAPERAGSASPSAPIVATTLLTATVSPSFTVISASTPAAGDGISASTLSVEISNSGSSRSTASPTFFSHRTIVPSATDSPICGITTGFAMFASYKTPTYLHMDRCTVRRMRGFTDGFRERRVRVNRPHQFLDRALEPQRQRCFGDKFGRACTDHVHAEHFIVLLVGDDFHEPFCLTGHLRPAEDKEWKGADSHVVALLLRLALGEANAADFRIAIGAGGHVIVVDGFHLASRDPLGRDDSLRRRNVRKLRMRAAAGAERDDVSHGGKAWNAGPKQVVDGDVSAISIEAERFDAEPLGHRPASC